MKRFSFILTLATLLVMTGSASASAQYLINQTYYKPVHIPQITSKPYNYKWANGNSFVGQIYYTDNVFTCYRGVLYYADNSSINGRFNANMQPEGDCQLYKSQNNTWWAVKYSNGRMISSTQIPAPAGSTPQVSTNGGNYTPSSGGTSNYTNPVQNHTATCRGCNGTGSCQHCNGTGLSSTGKSKCSLCGGRGRCVSCGGTGKVRL